MLKFRSVIGYTAITQTSGVNEMFKVYTNDELSNEDYHKETDHISGSSLSEMFSGSMAGWRYREREETNAFTFGTAAHTNILENDQFTKNYKRATDTSSIKDLITAQTGLSAALKARGVVGTSGKTYPDLIKMMLDNSEDFPVAWLIDMVDQAIAFAEGKELIGYEAYDNCVAMRDVLTGIPEYDDMMQNSTKELSIFGEIEGVRVKVRLDSAGVQENSPYIIDYKTSATANPKEFGRLAYNLGYYLKMALQHDLFVKAFEEDRIVKVGLLAQEKKKPFLPHLYWMQRDQLKIGRLQYMSVIRKFKMCKDNDIWPGYNNGASSSDLELPAWIRKEYEAFL